MADSDPDVPRDRRCSTWRPQPAAVGRAEDLRPTDELPCSRGYHVISLQQAWDYWHGASLPSRPIVISFDDGFAGHYLAARPILARHGWAGRSTSSARHVNQGSWSLSTKKIRGLIASDWEIDSHTLTHPALHQPLPIAPVDRGRRFPRLASLLVRPTSQILLLPRRNLRQSRHLGCPRSRLPGGHHHRVRRATPLTPYSLDRIRVNHGDGTWGLAAHLHALGLPT